MANSEFQYVRSFEKPDNIAPFNWVVIRIDGRGFSKFTKKYNFTKPNDRRALDLMNSCATEVLRSLTDVVLAYGQSDEYSFVLHEDTTLFERRATKLATTVATMFTAEYCMQWPNFFEGVELGRPYPTFDGRCVAYPKRKVLRDYLAWRQADCHVNNLYNTTFWNLALDSGMSNTEAESALKGTLASDKNELLFSKFGINYNNEPEIYRKGTVIYRAYDEEDDRANYSMAALTIDTSSRTQLEKQRKRKLKARIAIEHVDIIGNAFWDGHPYILASKIEDVEDE